MSKPGFEKFQFDYEAHRFKKSAVIHADCLEWLSRVPENSLHAIVTDPPYGVREYEADELEKRAQGKGGIWRIPPSFDGNVRAPLPDSRRLMSGTAPSFRPFLNSGRGCAAGRCDRVRLSLSPQTPISCRCCLRA